MAPLVITSCWFYLTNFVFFLINFVARHVFRFEIDKSSQKVKTECSVPLEPVPEANEIEERDFIGFDEEEEEKEEETSSFSFKFEYQIPKVSTLTYEEPSVSKAGEKYQVSNTNISNYRFSSERDCCVFVQEPKAATFQVHEAFVDSSAVKLDSKFVVSEKEFQGLAKEQEAVSSHEPVVDSSAEGEAESKSLSVEGFCGFVEEPEAVRFQFHESTVNSSEEKRRTESLAEEDFSWSDEEPEVIACRVHESFVDSCEVKLTTVQEAVRLHESFADRSAEEELETKSLSMEGFCGFVEEPEAIPFQFHEPIVNNSEDKLESESLAEQDFSWSDEEPEVIAYQVHESFVEYHKEKLGPKDVELWKIQKMEGKRPIELETNSEKEVVHSFSGFDSDSDSISLSDGYSVKKLEVDSESDGLLSERDFGDHESLIESSTFEMELMEGMEKYEEGQSSNSICQPNSPNIYEIGKISEEKLNKLQSSVTEVNYSPYTDKVSQLEENWSDNESLELELRELNEEDTKETHMPSSSNVQIELTDSSDDEIPYSRDDSDDLPKSGLQQKSMDFNTELDTSNDDHLSPVSGSEQTDTEKLEKRAMEEKSEDTKSKDFDDDDYDELESLWEHQDLIEQLKMELKRVRAIGLPTIFEESESPKTIEDLKPWKFDEKFLKEDPMDELHKFYKSYRERMRKFDILNYQKMYAIGFLQLKNPLDMMWMQKPLIPTILSHYRRKTSTNPSEKFMKELQVDLETVYVGQTCLSWEFLRWQYEKARELPDSDPYWSHQYNQVAGEFQQFQVILQRFIENESFQGPRLQNYVKNRCVLRNLLQVPVIKEDCLKDKMEDKRKGHYAITSEILEDIMEESIRIFWEFVKTDKDETSVILKGLIRNQVELQDPTDSKLMSEIQSSLQKKDKKLKDILKTGNCLVKKFKKPREDRTNQDLFFSQVDMKLISRVLKMSLITSDQLVWCHMKLSKITFKDRKIHREPSFLLFPC